MNFKNAITATAVALAAMGTGFASETDTEEVTVPAPKMVKQVAPEYPRAAERRNIEGTIVLKLSTDEAGKVVSVEVAEAEKPGIFDKAALDAAKKWKFEAGNPTIGFTKKLVFKLTS